MLTHTEWATPLSRNSSEPEPRTACQNGKLKILNSGKDFLIQQLRQERNGFFDKFLARCQPEMGELETKLLQLEAPQGSQANVNDA